MAVCDRLIQKQSVLPFFSCTSCILHIHVLYQIVNKECYNNNILTRHISHVKLMEKYDDAYGVLFLYMESQHQIALVLLQNLLLRGW